MENATEPTRPPQEDSGLRCLECEYNLTGLLDPVCPECGSRIDWDLVKRAKASREARAWKPWVGLPWTPWDSWRWFEKPVGFIVTALQIAFLPHVFARRSPAYPRLIWAVLFGAICVACLPLPAVAGTPVAAYWIAGAVLAILLQSTFLSITCPGCPWGVWLAVCCYASYPLIVQRLLGAQPAFVAWGEASTVWPLSFAFRGHTDIVTSVLFYLWWIDLVVVWYVKAQPASWWRLALVMVSVPAISTAVPFLLMGATMVLLS